MVLRMSLQTGTWLAVTAAVLFFAAGRIDWRPGWDFLVVMGVSTFGIGFWLARRDPSLLAKRLGSPVQKDQAPADKIFMPAALAAFYLWLVVMALDSGRFGWSRVPGWAQALGGLLVIATMALCSLVFRENSFAAPVVKIQAGQTVIATGPYAIVRHPMYAGALPLFVGAPLLLGSWWGLAFAPLFVLGIGWRAVMEEKTLRIALGGYDDYARQVRYRLAPFVW
jgi:protein-S-isoprenylcysteine O-methyltransferase Ste14